MWQRLAALADSRGWHLVAAAGTPGGALAAVTAGTATAVVARQDTPALVVAARRGVPVATIYPLNVAASVLALWHKGITPDRTAQILGVERPRVVQILAASGVAVPLSGVRQALRVPPEGDAGGTRYSRVRCWRLGQ